MPRTMNVTTRSLALALLALTACGPEVAAEDWGDTGDVECPDATAVECDDDGSCWVKQPGWAAWAQYADPAMISDGILAGVFVESLDVPGADAPCYTVGESDAHLCVYTVDCAPLLVRPLAEVGLGPSDCADDGPWEAAASIVATDGQCWGTLGPVAVLLDPNR